MENTGDTSTYELADVGTRFIAIFIDWVIIGVIIGILSNFGNAGYGIGFLAGAAYQWYFLTRNNGQTRVNR